MKEEKNCETCSRHDRDGSCTLVPDDLSVQDHIMYNTYHGCNTPTEICYNTFYKYWRSRK